MLPQHPVLVLVTLCCKLIVICLSHPPDRNDKGLGTAFCSLLYPSTESSAGQPVGKNGGKAREKIGYEVE